VSTPKPKPVPRSILPKRLQDGSYASPVFTFDAFGSLIRCESADSMDALPEGSIVYPSGEVGNAPLLLGDALNLCGCNRSYDPTVGVWINEDGTLTPPPQDDR
jgi:hypothetical protein